MIIQAPKLACIYHLFEILRYDNYLVSGYETWGSWLLVCTRMAGRKRSRMGETLAFGPLCGTMTGLDYNNIAGTHELYHLT